jgi:hypothetical protein
MEPFLISEPSKQLVDQYITSSAFEGVVPSLKSVERECFFRLWVSEGIPFAFKDAPMLFEAIRGWLALRLDVHPKEITIIGSARMGFSMSPPPEYGRLFGKHSDLDFAIISEKLFNELSADFQQWKTDFENGQIKPHNPTQMTYWEDNIKKLPMNISRGFIDAYKIPYMIKYKMAQKVGDTLYKLSSKLAITPDAPETKSSSLRVYCNWTAFIDQMKRNLYWI